MNGPVLLAAASTAAGLVLLVAGLCVKRRRYAAVETEQPATERVAARVAKGRETKPASTKKSEQPSKAEVPELDDDDDDDESTFSEI